MQYSHSIATVESLILVCVKRQRLLLCPPPEVGIFGGHWPGNPKTGTTGWTETWFATQNSAGSEKTCSHQIQVYSFCSWEWKIYHIVVLCCTVSYFFLVSSWSVWFVWVRTIGEIVMSGNTIMKGALTKKTNGRSACRCFWCRSLWLQIFVTPFSFARRTYSNRANICQPGSNIYIIHIHIQIYTYIQVLFYDLFVASPSQDTSRIRKQRPRSSKAEFLECT